MPRASRDLFGLVLGGRPGRCLGPDVDLLSRAQPQHGLREFVAGDLQGGVAQTHQLDDETASDAYGDHQGRDDGGEAEQHRGTGRGEQAPGEGVGPVRDVVARVRLDGSHAALHACVCLRPGRLGRGCDRLDARAGAEHLVLDGAPQSAYAVPATRFCQVARSGPRRSEAVASRRVRRVSTAPVNSRSRCPSRRPASRAPASRASSWASASPARENSSSTRASEPSSASWMPVSAPPTAKAAEMLLVYCAYVSAHPVRRSSTEVRSVRSCSTPATKVSRRSATPAGSSSPSATVLLLAEAQFRHGPVGALAERPEFGGRDGGRIGGVAYGGRAFGLECGDGGGDRRAHLGVDALQLPQPGDVLGCGDGGVRPQREQGDHRHHQEADDLGADGSWPHAPASRARGHLVGQGSEGFLGVFVGRRTGVRATSARRGGRRPGAGYRGPTGCTHGLLARSGSGCARGRRRPGARRYRAATLSTGRWADADASRSPAVGDSATNAEVRKR